VLSKLEVTIAALHRAVGGEVVFPAACRGRREGEGVARTPLWLPKCSIVFF